MMLSKVAITNQLFAQKELEGRWDFGEIIFRSLPPSRMRKMILKFPAAASTQILSAILAPIREIGAIWLVRTISREMRVGRRRKKRRCYDG
jgi:hypothetical protein